MMQLLGPVLFSRFLFRSLLTGFSLTSIGAVGQSQKVASALTETIRELKSRSMNSGKVNWDVLTKEAFSLAKDATSVYEMGPSIRYLFKSLDDFHGFFKYEDSLFRWQNDKRVIPQVYTSALLRNDNRFFTQSLGDIGYLRIPTTLASVAKNRSVELRDSICKILKNRPVGLIFDLRLNGGGHSMSMTMGISNVLEYGYIAQDDEVKADGFYRNRENIHPYQQACEKNTKIPIAVIVGPLTASSAEMLTIILKNRPETIIIGEPTAGAVTSVYGLMINKNINLGISTNYMTDVKNTVYKTSIQPDILISGGDNFDDLLQDAKIEKAVWWLHARKGHQ